MTFINLAFYKFMSLPEARLEFLKNETKAKCLELELKGTVLFATEGINCFIAGQRLSIDAFKSFLFKLLGTQDFPFKESPSDRQPFARMLVKIKREIISMGVPTIDPEKKTAPRLTPHELKTWYDENREMVVLDTRNDYEVRLGTFSGAEVMGLKTFRQFTEKAKALPADYREKTVVTFCTGGIRCEKASAYLMDLGFKNVYQLDGGILKYFEEVGKPHYEGDCFVFDYRVAVDAELQETQAVLCYNCQNPVTKAEQASPDYVFEVSCPYCINGKPSSPKGHTQIRSLHE